MGKFLAGTRWHVLSATAATVVILVSQAQVLTPSRADSSADIYRASPSVVSANAPGRTGSAESTAAAPPIGSTDTADVTPGVPRASGVPCVVELFRDAELYEPGRAWFGDNDFFAYAPPAACPGPWAKVIAKVSMENDAPSAYADGLTLAQIVIAGVPLYAGGGQFNNGATHWRVERDVTDYSAVLRSASDGFLELRAMPRYSDAFRARYRVSATLLFYPANPNNRAQRVPDQVHALTARGFGELLAPATPLLASLQLPRNIERAYLDVIAQPRYGNDLHWFTCLSAALLTEFPELTHPYAIGPQRLGVEGAPEPQGCKGGSFREVLVSIDGQPAGLAPVFPKVHPQFSASWTSTPLFQPSPAPRALSYLPYRVDLTPFAGILSDGSTHSVAVSMLSDGDTVDFDVSGTLLLYQDAGIQQVTGQLTRNTLPALLTPTTTDTVHKNSAGEVRGLVDTRSLHQYDLEGFVDTSRGRVQTLVSQALAFKNKQNVYAKDPAGTANDAYLMVVDLVSRATAVTRQWRDGVLIVDDADYLVLPLILDYQYGAVNLHQVVSLRSERWRPGVTRYYARLRHEAVLNYHLPGFGAPYWQSTQSYLFRDSHGSCHTVDSTANAGALNSYLQGRDCPQGRNRLFWAAHPDGSPDGLGWVSW